MNAAGVPEEAFEEAMKVMQERVRRAAMCHTSKEARRYPCDLRTIFVLGVEAMLNKWDEIDV